MNNSLLLTEFRRVVEFPDKEFAKLIPLFEPLTVKKNQHLFKAGSIAKHVYFIQKGCMRQYLINKSGEERTIYFQLECGWCCVFSKDSQQMLLVSCFRQGAGCAPGQISHQ